MLLPLLALSTSTTAQQDAILACLEAQLGKPYVWGSAGPDSFDCSGLTSYCHLAANITIPRTSSLQSESGTPVECANAEIGDLIFFYTPVSHVAAFSSSTDIIHAVNEDKPVSLYPNILANSYWAPQIRWCRRYWSTASAATPRPRSRTNVPGPQPPSRTNGPEPPAATATPQPQQPKGQQAIIVACLEEQLGKPYGTAGEGPDAFDSSGLVQFCFARAGIALPHNSRQQSLQNGTVVDCEAALPADLIFYFDPVAFVGTFYQGRSVIQVSGGSQVRVYEDIFANTYYGPEINFCKRLWVPDENEPGQEGGGATPGGGGSGVAPIVAGVLVAVVAVAVIVAIVVWKRRRMEKETHDTTKAPLDL